MSGQKDPIVCSWIAVKINAEMTGHTALLPPQFCQTNRIDNQAWDGVQGTGSAGKCASVHATKHHKHFNHSDVHHPASNRKAEAELIRIDASGLIENQQASTTSAGRKGVRK